MTRSTSRFVQVAAAGLAVLTALTSGCGGGGDAEIRRTEFGVPHIRALDERGLGYGIGYTIAEDNLCLVGDAMVTVRGERSKYFGPTATYDSFDSPTQGNLGSDFYFKYLNDPVLVKASFNRQPHELKDLLKGYAAGYNRYLKDEAPKAAKKKNRHADCVGQPWLQEITELDIIRLMRRFAVEASGSRFMDAFYAAQPPGAASAPAAPAAAATLRGKPPALGTASAAMSIQSPEYWDKFRTTLGSNAVALGKEATASSKGLLLGNPHYPWTTLFRFYQMHLTIPGKLDVMGVGLTGSPVINIGFNRDVAWSHTVSTSTHFTLFYLQLDPADPTRYIVDGQSRAMTKRTLSVDVGTGPKAPAPITRDYYFTDHGPLVVLPGLLEWTGQAAFAFADANFDNDRLYEHWWEINKSSSLAEFRKAAEGVLGNPWANTVATDRDGQVYYTNATPVPNVSAAKQAACVAAPFRPLVGNGIYVLAGNTSACNWDIDPAAVQKGLFAASAFSRMQRTDYVQNSNDSAWMTHPADRQTGYPPIMSGEGAPLYPRTRIGVTQIESRLAGTDGRPGNKFDLRSLQDITFSNQSHSATHLLADLRSACGGGGSVALAAGGSADITRGCSVLAKWDGRAETSSIGWPLFETWLQTIKASGVNFWVRPFDATDPIHTPSGLRVADSAVVLLARQSLAAAIKTLDDQKVDFTKPWGELQYAARGTKRIPVHGGGSNDIYNQMVGNLTADGQYEVWAGSSSVWTVSFENGLPKAQGFLSYSQSLDPASPYYADQTERFSQKKWITYPFTEAEIARDPKLTTIHLFD